VACGLGNPILGIRNTPACKPAAFLFLGEYFLNVIFRGVVVRSGVVSVSVVSALAAEDDCNAALAASVAAPLPAAAVAKLSRQACDHTTE